MDEKEKLKRDTHIVEGSAEVSTGGSTNIFMGINKVHRNNICFELIFLFTTIQHGVDTAAKILDLSIAVK